MNHGWKSNAIGKRLAYVECIVLSHLALCNCALQIGHSSWLPSQLQSKSYWVKNSFNQWCGQRARNVSLHKMKGRLGQFGTRKVNTWKLFKRWVTLFPVFPGVFSISTWDLCKLQKEKKALGNILVQFKPTAETFSKLSQMSDTHPQLWTSYGNLELWKLCKKETKIFF